MTKPPDPPPGPGPVPTGVPAPDDGTGREARPLPELRSAANIVPAKIVTPPVLIDSLLHRECKMVLAGGSKSFKSWSMVDLGISLASGLPWWGLNCSRGVVVYLNFELIEGFFEWRIHHVCKHRGIPYPPWFLYWDLRHICYDLSTVARVLTQRMRAMNSRVDLIIVDPIYKALGGLDENSAGDMGALMELIEDLSSETGAAVVFGAHFSKGNQAGKEAKDRISGSGVFGRDPDAILTMTRHKEEGSYTVESDLRYVPSLPDFVVSWRFPLLTINEGLDPSDLYVPHAAKVKPPGSEDEPLTLEQVLACLLVGGFQDSGWKAAVQERHGKSGPAYYALKKQLIDGGAVKRDGVKYLPTGFKLTQ